MKMHFVMATLAASLLGGASGLAQVGGVGSSRACGVLLRMR